MDDKQFRQQFRALTRSSKAGTGIKPMDILTALYLIYHNTEDRFITRSQELIADRFGCHRETISHTLDRLEKAE